MKTLRVVTYNIHKGVQGLGPLRRLEIHNLSHAMQLMDADVLCLQEVRKLHHREARHFPHWPQAPQADYLAPAGYEAIYRTNAITRHGEHGNALLSKWPVVQHQHEDMSDHRLEQRGLLHVELDVAGQRVHVLVVHLGLIRAGRGRQLQQLTQFIQREIPPDVPLLVAGDFNDLPAWVARQLAPAGLKAPVSKPCVTFPSRLPLVQLDHVLARGLTPVSATAPRGMSWARMSDHLPLITEWQLASETPAC
ncbi:endonuclease/exonuclease/phosphatase family protein [Rhodoferax mekongensis]|uniref:Endonuclease/exonuclease/phosphatase family protein n=1 Tax=Rhodoferax mekongensis TaxID=3068341 RepID=A0ABZ0B4J2_9BURK|nr:MULTISPECIES: endonuclease/exonuclease/phosphatase family protein [unclassified Rhodoferax]MDT7516405.1 endonuclease/exonuclease/phosphatase family protein [Rhodoferax sp. TBRC 17199]WNO06301.1 endonuclease/exonuclease/phosphatase family protein [Rhodoferax sp. TBRC 17307]